MGTPVDEDQENQREKIVMEEPTAITIEFLRARLLSERSISRAAIERANELAKRVVELEEKLKIVTLQRKKAERAAAQVLSILESNGVNDLSEEYYAGSDEEGPPVESKESCPMKEGKSVTASWTNCGSSNSVENKKHFSQSRGLSSPVSDGGSSMKQHLGKSSCTMKQKEIRSAAGEERNDPHVLEVQENGALIQYGDDDNFESILKGDAKDEETKASLEALAPDSLEEQGQETNNSLFFNGNRRDANMEMALEHHAQLIGRYEEEEDAQREWEAKFGETNSTHDYCEPGNQSDITEECDEVREEEKDKVKEGAIKTAKTSSPHEQGVNLGLEQVWHAEAMTKTVPYSILPSHFDCGCSQDQQGNNLTANKSKTSMLHLSVLEQEKPKSESNRKQKQEHLENSLLQTPLSLFVEHQPIHKTSSFNEDSSLRKGKSSGVQNELQTVAHHGTPTGLGGVLEALQLAKFSLNHKLNSLPLPPQSRPVEREKETPVLAIEGSDSTTEIPVKPDGLFQVPSSSQIKAAATHTDVLGTYSDPRSSLMRQYPSAGVGAASDYHTNVEMPMTPQFEANTRHQMNLLGVYPDSRFSISGSYPSPELGFAADHHPNLNRPTSSQWEATDIQRNLLKTYPDSRSSMTRYYPSPEISVATNKHANSEMGFGISNHSSLIDPYMNIGISQSAYSRYTYPSYADYASRTPIHDKFSRSYASVGSGMPAEDSSSAYDSQYRWNMHQR